MADEQHPPGRSGAGQRVDRLTDFEAARQRLVDGQALALILLPGLGGQLGGLRRAHLRAVEDRVEAGLHARQRDTCRARLPLAPLGQAPSRVLPASMRLSLCVSK